MSKDEATRARLLIVDDDAAQMQALANTLQLEGYAPSACSSAAKALEALRQDSFELVLTDLTMPQMNGIEFLEAARHIDPQIIGIVMTGHGSIDTAVAAMRAGALDYILKPFTLTMIRPVLERALTVRRLQVENLQLRQAQEEHTRQLKEANTELEAFSHSVSHDLRAPLRAVHAFTRMLADEYGAALDDKGRGYIDRVVGSTERMENLIEDMLRLSHVNAMELRRIRVDLSQMARAIVEDLASREADRRVEAQITSGLRCDADPRLLRIALENLIGNAWKFTRKVARARIEFGAVLRDGVQEYFVRDNGAGFNAEFAKDMFAPFRRLHTASEFPGTGVGLSIVQRVIRRHGGSVWAEGAVDHGATFYFTIPGADDAPRAESRG
jgi:signal transduction histidine kinase